MIWQFKIVIYFISGIYHVSCALNPRLKFLDATYVQITSQGSDITSQSLSLPLIPSQNLIIQNPKSQRPYKACSFALNRPN